MSITQTVDIPASRRLTIDVPPEVPVGKARVVIHFPVSEEADSVVPPDTSGVPEAEKGQMSSAAFREALRRTQGAWKNNPWTTHVEDINAMRDEWDHRDPWNPDPAKRHRD